MPLTLDEIETAYRLFLERSPTKSQIANIRSQHDSLAGLREVLLNSEEFYHKFKNARARFEERQTPILVQMLSPEATPEALLSALAQASELQPGHQVDKAGFDALCALPRPERLKLRHIYGDLKVNAGTALNLPWRRLFTLRRPGPRLYQMYRTACAAQNRSDMRFGTFLDYSVQSTEHRIELDNGQMRRLAGRTGAASLGQEAPQLRLALHMALSPDTILGLYERPGALLQTLAAQGFLTLADTAPDTDPDFETGAQTDTDAAYDAALRDLSSDEQLIFDGYTAWDSYLYDVCDALLFPSG